MSEVAITHRKSKNVPHARTSQVSTKWVRTRTSQIATAHRNSPLAISHRKSCLGQKVPKLNSRLVYCSRIYGIFWIEWQATESNIERFLLYSNSACTSGRVEKRTISGQRRAPIQAGGHICLHLELPTNLWLTYLHLTQLRLWISYNWAPQD